ncbi:MAG: Microbial serine proteinase [Syntrophus sp. SKADARSKE-3]|nr:Microbial serine proteinase [Syntrophus sp. SKADARSKE-3]
MMTKQRITAPTCLKQAQQIMKIALSRLWQRGARRDFHIKTKHLLLAFCVLVLGCSGGGSGTPSQGDPLLFQQWYLNNTGQAAFSQNGGVAGEDLQMAQALADYLSGAGVIIAILDDSLEIAHEDLAANVIPNGSWNYVTQTTDPTSTFTTGEHGTSVAGIAAAVGWNGVGGRGVAPWAYLKGFNVLEAQTTQNYIDSMGGHPRSQDVHIFNMSYGNDSTAFSPLPQTARDLYSSSSTLRKGKGGIYVKSAGNGFLSFKNQINNNIYNCTDEKYGRADLTCENAVADEENSRPEVITVGAFNANGVRSSYSTAGSNLWVSAPGGEYGTNSPAMITTDQSTCSKGYSRFDLVSPANKFEIGDSIYNEVCNYTSAFNGTSAAAPAASGAVALMLQVNPNLTRRDVKYILAKTARKIDPNSIGASVTVNINGTDYQAGQGWITNAAGFNFHNWYGFGAVSVDAAIAMARNYQTTLPTLQDKSYGGAVSPVMTIPDNDAKGVTKTIDIADNLTIENFSLLVAINHPNTGEIGIEIISPSGTKSIILNIRSALKTGLNTTGGVILSSNAFFGEKSKGTWTLKVLDSWPGNTGSLTYFGLQVLGY